MIRYLLEYREFMHTIYKRRPNVYNTNEFVGL